MPKNSKIRGMTSLEIAIIVAIVLVIAIAVGWYLYQTFSTASQQTGVTITEAIVYVKDNTATLYLKLVPQGAAQVQIDRIEIAGKTYTCTGAIISGPSGRTLQLSGLTLSVGQVVSGRVVLASGMASPFTASVVSGDVADENAEDLSCSPAGGSNP